QEGGLGASNVGASKGGNPMRFHRILVAGALLVGVLPRAGSATTLPAWPVYGHDISNTRHQTDSSIDASNVATLKKRWFFSTGADVTGTPIVAEGKVFIGDTLGDFFAIDAASGTQLWKRTLSGPVFSTAAYDGGKVFVGDNLNELWAFNAADGSDAWAVDPVQVETDPNLAPYAQYWGSPVPFDGGIYVGLSGEDKELAVSANRKVWRGSVNGIDEQTGQVLFHTHTVRLDCAPSVTDCNGGSVWATPAIDPVRRLAYFGVGNAYDAPAADTTDSIVAVDIDARSSTFGSIVKTHQFTSGDYWSHSLQGALSGNPDWDFGSSPVLFDEDGHALLAEGQKSGDFRVVDRDSLDEQWEAHFGGGRSGGFAGGILASPAFDGSTFYIGTSDDVVDSPVVPTVSKQVALSTSDHAVRWTNYTPVWAWSAPAYANGLVFAGETEGEVLALDATSGLPLWASDNTGGIIASGPSVAGDAVYIGTACCGGASSSSGVWSFGLPGV
ncbi:MAG: PQQ-binding-like beta-propeller repeat protein, partial [Actinomycetota bacterium]